MPSLFEQNPPQIMMCILQKAGNSSDGYERDRKLRNGKIIFEKIKNIEDLKGKEIYTIGKGLTPDIILQTILKENGINPDKDLRINYLSGGNEIAPMYLAGKIDIIMVSEPVLSKILSKDKRSEINFDMNNEWKKVFKDDIGFPQSTLIVKENLIKEEPEFISAFINKLENSIEFIYGKSLNKEKYIINYVVRLNWF